MGGIFDDGDHDDVVLLVMGMTSVAEPEPPLSACPFTSPSGVRWVRPTLPPH